MSLMSPREGLHKIKSLIKKRRLDLNLSQVMLAERAGVNLFTLRKFEQQGKISLTSFLKITLVLDLLPDMIKSLEDKKIEFSSMDELLKSKKILKQRASTKRKNTTNLIKL